MEYMKYVIIVYAIIAYIEIKDSNRAKRLKKSGYEFIAASVIVICKCNQLWMKDGVVYLMPKIKAENAVPVEVIGISEVSRNARLIALDIRYRVNGEVRSVRRNGTTNQLLTIEDKLGYGG
ncbi:MAG: hypothetical protein LBK23_01975 [Oscillospiraceae bacterium]|jgi:hypothetical protein|nr:hypothetical protein [Oscillospiraceae bacterium]